MYFSDISVLTAKVIVRPSFWIKVFTSAYLEQGLVYYEKVLTEGVYLEVTENRRAI